MKPKVIVAILVAAFVFVGMASAQYGTAPGIAPAHAQDAKPSEPKGVTTRGLVSSAAPITSIAMTVPVTLTGQVVDLEPGGQTGKQRNLVPSFLYVLEGTLVIDTEGGPIGVWGIQYHGKGQAYAGPVGLWYNAQNTSQTPVRYVILFVATPGAKTVEQAKAED